MAASLNTLVKIGRLKKRSEFLRCQRQGQKWAAPGLVLQCRTWNAYDLGPEKRDGGVAVGFTTSKKVGNAVARNRARRRLRALVSEVFPDYVLSNRDFVLVGREQTIRRPWKKLVEDLKTALKRLDAYRKTPGKTFSPEDQTNPS